MQDIQNDAAEVMIRISGGLAILLMYFLIKSGHEVTEAAKVLAAWFAGALYVLAPTSEIGLIIGVLVTLLAGYDNFNPRIERGLFFGFLAYSAVSFVDGVLLVA